MKKRRVVAFMLTSALVLSATGCSGKETTEVLTDPEPPVSSEVEEPQAEVTPEAAVEATTAPEAEAETEAEITYPSLPLPEYHYYGTEEWAEYGDSVCQFLMENSFGKEESDLTICVPAVVKVDDSDPKDVKLWGEYQVYTFQLVNTSLLSQAGGSYGGVAHLDTTGGSPLVTDMEFLEDGSDYDPSLEKLFGAEGLKDDYIKVCDESKTYLDQALANYINHNGLYITQYQQYGWPPVSILNAPPTKDEDQMIYHVSNFAYTTEFDMRQVCLLEQEDVDVFSNVYSDEWNDFLVEIYAEESTDIDEAIKNIRSNLYDENAELTRNDDVPFNDNPGCTLLCSEGPYKDGDHVYVNYIIPKDGRLLVIKISSIYSQDEEKQMTTDGIIESLLGRIELK